MNVDPQVVQRNWRLIWSAAAWALVDTVVVFGALGWLYGALVAVFNPDDLSDPIVSWLPIRRDTLAVICFGLSAPAYLLRQIGERSRRRCDA